jgi:hypothetical protein
VLHEALDRAQGPALGIPEPFRHGCLHVEGEALLGPACQEVQVAAHRPQEVLAAAKGGVFVGGEDRRFHRAGAEAVAVEIFGQPMQGMQVAQAALAVLDVGLDPVARFAGAPVALVALGELGLHELPRRAVDDLALEALHQLAE